jgi:hypothetical protein
LFACIIIIIKHIDAAPVLLCFSTVGRLVLTNAAWD